MRKPLLFIAFAILGLIGAFLVIPSTRWIPLMQWDVLVGRWRLSGASMGEDGKKYMEPTSALLYPDPAGEQARFLTLLNPPPDGPHQYSQDEFYQRIEGLYEFAKKSGRPDYYAQMIRVASQVATIRNEPTQRKTYQSAAEEARQKKARKLLLQACLEAEKLDPTNAFFPLVAVSAYYQSGQRKAADEALLRASRLPKYADYVRLEPQLRLEQIEHELGYRGEPIRAWILAMVLFYHSANLRATGRFYTDTGDPEFRSAVARLATLMMRQDDNLIGIFVARAMFSRAVRKDPQRDEKPAKIAIADAEELEAAVPGDQGIVEAARQFNAIDDLVKGDGITPKNIDDLLNMRSAVSAGALALLLFVAAGLGVLLLRNKFPRSEGATPLLIGLSALPLEPAGFDLTNYSLVLAACALLAIPAMWPKARSVAYALALLVSVTGVLFILVGGPEVISPTALSPSIHEGANSPLPTLFALGVTLLIPLHLWSRRTRAAESPILVSIWLLAVCLAAATLWVLTAIRRDGGTALLFGGLGFIGFACSVPKPDRTRLSQAALISLAIAGVGYAFGAFQDMSANVRAGAAADAMTHEADRLRREAGVR